MPPLSAPVLQPPRDLASATRLQQQIAALDSRLSFTERLLPRAIGGFSATAASVVGINQSGAQVTLGTEAWDYSGWYDTGTGRFTPKIAGLYMFTVRISISTTLAAEQTVYAGLWKNGAAFEYGQLLPSQATNNNAVSYAGVAEANGTTDYFTPALFQTTGGSVNLGACRFSGFLVGTP